MALYSDFRGSRGVCYFLSRNCYLIATTDVTVIYLRRFYKTYLNIVIKAAMGTAKFCAKKIPADKKE